MWELLYFIALLQELEICAFVLGGPGRFLHELNELTQTFALGWHHSVETDANSVLRTAAGDDAAQRKTLHPDLAIWHPEADFHFRAGLDGVRCFNQTAAHAGIGKVAPYGRRRLIDAQLDRDEALDSWIAPAVASPVRAE